MSFSSRSRSRSHNGSANRTRSYSASSRSTDPSTTPSDLTDDSFVSESDRFSRHLKSASARSASLSGTNSASRRSSRSKLKKKTPSSYRPISSFKRVRDSATKEQIRDFLDNYAKDDNFEAFTISVDSMPFVAISLLNAEKDLLTKFYKIPPPTPMKVSIGKSSPRKRNQSSSLSTTTSSKKNKSVRFVDENDENENLQPVTSDLSLTKAQGKNERKYRKLWNDRRS